MTHKLEQSRKDLIEAYGHLEDDKIPAERRGGFIKPWLKQYDAAAPDTIISSEDAEISAIRAEVEKCARK